MCSSSASRCLYRTRWRGQCVVLVLTFLSYAAYHVTRKSFSYAKVNLSYPSCNLATTTAAALIPWKNDS